MILPGEGLMIISSFGLLSFTSSLNVSSTVLPLKLIWLLSGDDFMRMGGFISLGPPVGVVRLAQLYSKRAIAIRFENLLLISLLDRLDLNNSFLELLCDLIGSRA